MCRRYNGFTLVELISVIAVLAILAAFAVAKYANLTTSSKTAAITSLAAALSAVSADNYAKKTANLTSSTITDCSQIGALLDGGSLPSGYCIQPASITAGSTAQCTLALMSSPCTTIPGGTVTTTFLGYAAP